MTQLSIRPTIVVHWKIDLASIRATGRADCSTAGLPQKLIVVLLPPKTVVFPHLNAVMVSVKMAKAVPPALPIVSTAIPLLLTKVLARFNWPINKEGFG